MEQDRDNKKVVFRIKDYGFFQRCLQLAEEALKAGDQPFGSLLVNKDNEIIAEARNRVNEMHALAHPEIELAQWALKNLTLQERRQTIMYTSGEHCPMCAGAHSWSQIGGLYYLSSADQLGMWLKELEAEDAPITLVSTEKIVKGVVVKGPGEGEMVQQIKQLHALFYSKNA